MATAGIYDVAVPRLVIPSYRLLSTTCALAAFLWLILADKVETGDLELQRVLSLEVPTGLQKEVVTETFEKERGRFTDSGIELDGYNDVTNIAHTMVIWDFIAGLIAIHPIGGVVIGSVLWLVMANPLIRDNTQYPQSMAHESSWHRSYFWLLGCRRDSASGGQ